MRVQRSDLPGAVADLLLINLRTVLGVSVSIPVGLGRLGDRGGPVLAPVSRPLTWARSEVTSTAWASPPPRLTCPGSRLGTHFSRKLQAPPLPPTLVWNEHLMHVKGRQCKPRWSRPPSLCISASPTDVPSAGWCRRGPWALGVQLRGSQWGNSLACVAS